MFDKAPNIFNIALWVLFGVFIIGGVAALAFYRGTAQEDIGEIVVWGALPSNQFNGFLKSLQNEKEFLENVTYEEQDPRTYYTDIVNALAAGRGPDLFILDQNSLVSQLDKIRMISFDTLPERSFRTQYAEGAEVFLQQGGIAAIPFAVDPLVMYWNRDLFFGSGVANPPLYWDEFIDLSERLTILDANQNILQSTVAFGGYDNVTNAKEILSTLLLQLRIPMVELDLDGKIDVSLTRPPESIDNEESFGDGTAAIRFYTEFGDPVRSVYSWNRSLPSSREAFLAGDLAVYFGYASEFPEIAVGNPNLNYDIASVPRVRGTNRRITYGNFSAFAIPRSSSNSGNAFAAARAMSDALALQSWSETTNLPPVHRALLANPPGDAYGSIVYDAALNAHTWPDPNPAVSDIILQTMIDDISSGREDVRSAIGLAERTLERSR